MATIKTKSSSSSKVVKDLPTKDSISSKHNIPSKHTKHRSNKHKDSSSDEEISNTKPVKRVRPRIVISEEVKKPTRTKSSSEEESYKYKTLKRVNKTKKKVDITQINTDVWCLILDKMDYPTCCNVMCTNKYFRDLIVELKLLEKTKALFDIQLYNSYIDKLYNYEILFHVNEELDYIVKMVNWMKEQMKAEVLLMCNLRRFIVQDDYIHLNANYMLFWDSPVEVNHRPGDNYDKKTSQYILSSSRTTPLIIIVHGFVKNYQEINNWLTKRAETSKYYTNCYFILVDKDIKGIAKVSTFNDLTRKRNQPELFRKREYVIS